MSTNTLIVMRHAKSDWTTDCPTDFERPVSPRGQQELTRMAQWFKTQQLYPKCILCSPAKRTQYTLQALQTDCDLPEHQTHYPASMYGASLNELLSLINLHKKTTPLMLIGHNPGLDYLVKHLPKQAPSRNAKGKLMTTASIAILCFSQGIDIEQGSAQLQSLQRPRMLLDS